MIPLPPDILRRISALPNGLEVLSIFADFLELVVTPPTVTKTDNALRQQRYRERHAVTQKGSPDGSPNAMSPTPPKDITPPSPLSKTPQPTKRVRARKARTAIAEDQPMTTQDIDFALQYVLRGRMSEEWVQFRDHHRKSDSRMADWPAAWRTWVRRVGRFESHGRSNGSRRAVEAFLREEPDDAAGREEGTGQAVFELLPNR